MIAQLRGVVDHIGLDSVTLLVGGMGFRVLVPPPTAQALERGGETTIHTHLVVREDSLTLVGFRTSDERDVFERLLSVSGIGPKIALAALAVLTPDELRRAVSNQDLTVLQRIPGVGRKSAQRMVLEIGDKLGLAGVLPGHDTANATDGDAAASTEVTAALVQLGWTEAVASKTVDSLAGNALSPSDLLRSALLKLGGHRG